MAEMGRRTASTLCAVALAGYAVILTLGAGLPALGQADGGPAAVGIVAPSEADGVLSKAAALTEAGQDAEALKALAALDESKLSGAALKRYGDECDAILKPIRDRCDALRKAGQFPEAIAVLAPYDAVKPLPKRFLTGLRQADGWVRVDWAAQLRDSKKYLEAIAVVQAMDPVANATSPARIHAANTLRGSATAWARGESEAVSAALASAAERVPSGGAPAVPTAGDAAASANRAAARAAAIERMRAAVEKVRGFALPDDGALLAQTQYNLATALLAAARYDEALAAVHASPLSPRERGGGEGFPTTATWGVLQDAAKFPERCAGAWTQAEFAETRKLLDEARKTLDAPATRDDPAARAAAESARTAAETGLAAAVERVRADVEKARRLGAVPGGQVDAQTRYELADTLLRAGRYDDALVTVRTVTGPTTATWGVLQSAAAFPERCTKTYLDNVSKEFSRLCETKGSEQAAYDKLNEIRGKLDAWKPANAADVRKDKEATWARGVVARIRDEKQFNEALNILAADNQTGGLEYTAPVVRDKEITKENLEKLIDLWQWARKIDPKALLCKRAGARGADLPLDSPLFNEPAFGWSAVWMLIESGKHENLDKADALIQRLFENNAVEAELATTYSLYLRGRHEECIAAADCFLKNPDSGNTGGTITVESRLWASVFKLRSLSALGRTEEARTVARGIVERWPKSSWTLYASQWLARQGGEGEGSATGRPGAGTGKNAPEQSEKTEAAVPAGAK